MLPKEMLPYVGAILLLMVGTYAIVAKKNIVKIIVGLLVVDYAVNLFLLLLGYRDLGRAPIYPAGVSAEEYVSQSVDPLPQALVLTSIVIGLGVVAVMVSLALRLHEKYGTFDITRIRKLRG